MENEILNSINELKYILYFILVISILAVASIIYFIYRSVKQFSKETSAEVFEHLAQEQLDKGQYSELIEDAKSFLKNRPNNLRAIWYAAVAYYYTKDYENAKKYFEKIIELDITWKDSVQPYMEDIETKTV